MVSPPSSLEALARAAQRAFVAAALPDDIALRIRLFGDSAETQTSFRLFRSNATGPRSARAAPRRWLMAVLAEIGPALVAASADMPEQRQSFDDSDCLITATAASFGGAPLTTACQPGAMVPLSWLLLRPEGARPTRELLDALAEVLRPGEDLMLIDRGCSAHQRLRQRALRDALRARNPRRHIWLKSLIEAAGTTSNQRELQVIARHELDAIQLDVVAGERIRPVALWYLAPADGRDRARALRRDAS